MPKLYRLIGAGAIGLDLTNDHPVGIVLPLAQVGNGFNDPATTYQNRRFYDGDSDARPNANEIRLRYEGWI